MERTEEIKRSCIRMVKTWYFGALFLCIWICLLPLFILKSENPPMELKEVFDLLLSMSYALMEKPIGGIFVALMIFGMYYKIKLSRPKESKYKTDELTLCNNISFKYHRGLLKFYGISVFFLCFFLISNGNMVFLYCQIIPIALLIFKYPTKDKIDRMIEEAVNKNNMLPDAPPKAPDANK